MPCPDCTKQHSYNLNCPACCARMVLAARPSRERQEGVFELIARNQGARREEILKQIELLKLHEGKKGQCK